MTESMDSRTTTEHHRSVYYCIHLDLLEVFCSPLLSHSEV